MATQKKTKAPRKLLSSTNTRISRTTLDALHTGWANRRISGLSLYKFTNEIVEFGLGVERGEYVKREESAA